MSDELYPNLQMADMSLEPEWLTEAVEFETGWTQRNALWLRPRARFRLRYPILYPSEYDLLLNHWLRHRGQYEAFWFADFTDLRPRARTFGIGDGVTRLFRLPHDRTMATVIYDDGAVVTAVHVDPDTGWVFFNAAPGDRSILTYDGDDCLYRTRFASDNLPIERHKFLAWGSDVELVQTSEPEDAYPISQVIYGGSQSHRVLDAVGEGAASRFICPQNITITTAWYYAVAGGTPGNLRVAIYSDDGGEVGTQLVSATQAIAGAAAWRSIALAATALVRNQAYWLVITADSPTFNGGNLVWIYCTYVEVTPTRVWEIDALNYGAYSVTDEFCKNWEHAGLGYATLDVGGAWTEIPYVHEPFWLTSAGGDVVGFCYSALQFNVYDGGVIGRRARQRVLVSTTNPITIDRIGIPVAIGNQPADDLYYRLELLSDPGVTKRGLGAVGDPGVLCVAAANIAAYVEVYLSSPLTIAVGDTLYVDFLSPLSAVGAPWTIRGHVDGDNPYDGNWQAAWDARTWDGATQNAQESTDSGVTWATTRKGAWALKCRGWWEV